MTLTLQKKEKITTKRRALSPLFSSCGFAFAAVPILILLAVVSCRRHDDAPEALHQEWQPGKLDSYVIFKIDQSAPRAQEALRLLEQHRWDDAITTLRRARAEDPKSATAHYNLGIVLLPTRAHDEGRRELEEALRLNRNYRLAAEALRVADRAKLPQ